jgi:putative inorganic carbon (HCO3(-)) transporter
MGTGIGHYIPTIAYLGFWVMAVVALFGRPIYGFYYILPFLPYRTMQDHFQGLPLATNLVTILLVCILIGAFFKGKRPPSSKLYVTWFLFVLYLYFSMWIGTAMGNEPPPLWLSDLNFVGWKDYIVLPLLFLAAGMVIEDRQHVRNVILIVAVALFLVDRSALAESLSHSWTAFDESKRTSGPIAYGPNQLAAFLAQFGMFFWGVARILKRPRVKLVLYSLVGMTLLTTLYTFSRAAYIAVLVSAFCLALVKDRKLIIVLVAFMFTWQVLLPAAVTERVSMTHNSDGKLDESAQERVDLWTQSRDIFLRSPIFGAGFSSFQYGNHTDNLKDTHNYFVKVLVETGVIGFFFFVALLIQLIIAGYRLFRKAEDPLYKALGLGFFLAMISCTIANLFGDRWTYVEINGLLWALAGAVLRADALSTTTDAKQPMAYAGNRFGLPPRRQLAQ